MKICFIFIMTMIVFIQQKTWARFVVGNGGDAILCAVNSDNKLSGYYSLDYVLTLVNRHGDDGLAPVSSWQNSAERIYNLLLEKTPSLAPYFREFRENVFNKDYTKTKVWEPTPFGLVELDDQNITSIIPENCKKDGKTQITQTVIREFQIFSGVKKGYVIYKYDPEMVASLDKNSPLQLSMLLVHEWLWDLSQNVERNRRVNRFLHSKEIESMSSEAVIDSLKNMGLFIPDRQADIFDDRICQGTPITAKDFNEYYPKPFTLSNWGALSIGERQREVICPQNMISCNSTWKKSIIPSVLTDHPFFLSPSWKTDRSYPLKIISPQYLQSIGRSVQYGVGQIACRFINDSQQNLECKVQDTKFYYPLFNQSSAVADFQDPSFIMKATLTTECFRLKVTSYIQIQSVSHEGNAELKLEKESVFYLRAPDNLFLR